ncbi:hypothetical protein [Ruegeria sp. EL01]|jgi:hypothetical protein|uniref:hypothetical protein n=1 Tax=Ruegeria sp. EL01 TaxID=2107578 RepID=UPI000EA8356F|nr:hypothetical protein [Ruegeria sp. EL01]
MTYEHYLLIWLYIFGAAGFGTATIRTTTNISVFDFLMIVAWPITMPLYMMLRLVFNEIFGR